MDSMANDRTHWRILLLIIVVGALLRLYHLDRLPPGFHYDEAFEGLEAWHILTDPTYRPLFLTGNFGVPPLNSYANALMFWAWQLLGLPIGPTAMRVTAACFGGAGLIALWFLARELRQIAHQSTRLSSYFPLWALFVLATMRWHIHFSRMGIEPIIVPLVWTGATALLLYGWRTGRQWSFAASGIVLASGMYAYQGAWIIPFLMVVTTILLYLKRKHPLHEEPTPILYRFSGIALAAIIALVFVAPLGWFFTQNLDLVFLRPAQLSIVGETSSPADNSLSDSIWATAKMFGPFGSPGDQDPRRNLPGAPALTIWYALPFYLGLGISLWRIRQPGYALILVGLVGLLLPGVISEYAPHFHRIVGAAAPVALLCAIGFDALWQWRPLTVPVVKVALGQIVVFVLLVAGAVQESQNYFVRWAALPDLFHAFDVGLWQIGEQIAAQSAESPIYLSPRTVDHATLAFAWQTAPDAHAPPITFDGRTIFPLTAGTNPQEERYVVIEHEDFRTPLLWPGLFADGQVVDEITDANGNTYAQTYVRPVGAQIQREPSIYLHEDHSIVQIGDGIGLLGYDAQPAQVAAGEILYLQLYWLTDHAPTADWTVFTHVLDVETDNTFTLTAGQDSQPGGGSLSTDRWQAGWLILDEYQISLPSDLQPGRYLLATGLYQSTGERLPIGEETGGRVLLGSIEIE